MTETDSRPRTGVSPHKTLTIVISGCLLLLADAFAAGPGVMPRVGVLVLRNGEVLQGQITQAGDRYIVTWGDGGEVRVPAGDVEMSCRDMEEAYLRKRATAELGGLGRHLELADWCLRHTLLTQAADEVLAATAIEPNHPRIRMLERRLQLAAGQSAPQLSSPVRPQAEVNLSEMKQTLRELPDAAVEKYTVHLQPLLLNRCGANTCHGVASNSEYRLMRPSWGKTMTRRYTQRNLFATLQQINTRCPEQSPLLTVPSAPHGSLDRPAFGERDQPQVKVLEEWLRQVAKQDLGPAPKTISTASSPLLQTGLSQPQSPPQGPAPKTSAAPHPSEQTPAPSPGPLQRPLPYDGFVPRDAFDPEIFNRRFFGSDAVSPK
jgi:hypothetical protein